MDILGSYQNLWKILKLKNIHYLIAFYLTASIGSAAGSLATLKLVEKGVPKEQVAFFSIPLIPIKLLSPIIISKFTVGNNSMGVWMYAYPVGLLFGLVYPIIIFWTPGFAQSDGQLPYSYYILLFFIFAAQLLPGYTKFVAGMAFSAKVSDPAIGGTYMTLINTVSNVGSMWTTSVSLWLVDYVAIPLGNDCLGNGWDKYFHDMRKLNGSGKGAHVLNKTFYSLEGSSTIRYEDVVNLNSSMGGVPTCSNIIDGYYVECAVCIVLGLLWMAWGRPTILRLQRMPLKSWRVFN
jgi:PAT family acetyl-CoA transporter-like MFS transporter 1